MPACLALALLASAAAVAGPPRLAPSLLPVAAQDEPAPTPPPAPATPDSTKTPSSRAYQLQLNARFRYISVPDSILDIFAYDEDDPGYPQTQTRPKVRALAYGAELVFDRGAANYVIWGQYADSKLREGYWDDVDDAYVDHEDGEYVVPRSLGAGALGFDFMHELDVVPVGPEGGPVGLSFLFGAGLGVAFVTGELETWKRGGLPETLDAGCLPTSPAYERFDQGCESDGYKRIPKVLPVLDLSLSMRFNFSDHAHLRLDGGIHEALFLGAAAGAIF